MHFLNDIFANTTNPIEDIRFISTSQVPEIASQRVSLVDVMCQDWEGNRFIVEIQVVHEPGFVKRAQYYAAKAYIEQRRQGYDYKDLQRVTFLAIANFTLFADKQAYLSHHKMLDADSHAHDLQDFAFCFLELPKFTKSKDQLKTLVEKWAYFFKHADETHEDDLQQIIGSDAIIKRAYDELNRYYWSADELRHYDSADMKRGSEQAILDYAKEQGLAEGKAEGLQQGRLEAMRIIVNTMRAQQLNDTQISVFTGLTSDEIKLL